MEYITGNSRNSFSDVVFCDSVCSKVHGVDQVLTLALF